MNNGNIVKTAVSRKELSKIAKVFRQEIEKITGINHVTIHLIFPDHKSFCLTSSYDQVEHYVKNQYGEHDHSLITRYSDNLPFYSWDITPLTEEAANLNKVKRDIYGFYSGVNFVRKFDDFRIVYSVATFIKDPVMLYVMLSKANQILESGDYLFNCFHDIYQGMASVDVPEIDVFHPFTGGIEGLIPNYQYQSRETKSKACSALKDKIIDIRKPHDLFNSEIMDRVVSEIEADSKKQDGPKKPKLYIVGKSSDK